MTQKLDPEEKQRRAILSAIKGNATRNAVRTYKPERKRRRYSTKKYAGRYLPWEQPHGVEMSG